MGNPGPFEKDVALFLVVVETKIKIVCTRLFLLYDFGNDLQSRRSKVKVTVEFF